MADVRIYALLGLDERNEAPSYVPFMKHAESRERIAWHFLHSDNKLRDGRTAPPDGEWLTHDGEVVPCTSGLHASERALDALNYSPVVDKIVLCRVEVRGTIKEHAGDGNRIDKLAASERRILWRLDGEATDRILREHARWSASQVLHLWDAPQVVKDYLATGAEDLRGAAWAAAEDAAWAAAEGAAGDAAWAAAWAAARAAVRAAVRAAARAAARGAARGAAEDAAWAAQNAHLEALFNAAHYLDSQKVRNEMGMEGSEL